MKFIKEIIKELFVKKNLAVATVAVSFVMLLGFGFNALMNKTFADDSNTPGCEKRGQLMVGQITESVVNGKVTATITNKSSNCSYDVGLASYKKLKLGLPHDGGVQELFDDDMRTGSNNLKPGQTLTLTVDAPACNFQIDLFAGPFPSSDGVYQDDIYHLFYAYHDNSRGSCVNQCPADLEDARLTSPKEVRGLKNGDNIDYQITFTGDSRGVVDVVDVRGLPEWWNIEWDPTTDRVIGKIPHQTSANQMSFTVFFETSVDGKMCKENSERVTIFWDSPEQCPIGSAPEITSSGTAFGVVGQQFIKSITFTGKAPVDISISGNLPPGLSFNSSTNKITGTPTQPGVFDVVVKATNQCDEDVEPLRITISTAQCPGGVPSISGDTNATGTVGTQFSYTAVVTGNTENVTLTGNLPPGLSFNGNTRTISGIPTQAGVFNVVLTASNQCGEDPLNLRVTISEGVCPLDPPVLPESRTVEATLNQSLNFTIPLTSGDSPITYSIQSGTLPPGLSLSGNKIVGTPTRAVTRDVVIRAENACGFDTMNLRIKVTIPQCPIDPPALGEDREFNLIKGQNFNFTIPVVGGGAIDSFHIIRGSLPNGLTFSNGKISGTPTATGSFMVEIQAENECGADSIELRFNISEEGSQCPDLTPPNVTSGSNFEIKAGQGFDYLITFTGDDDIEIEVENLPSWLDFNENTNRVSGIVPSNDDFSFTVKLTQTADGEFCAEDVHVVNLSPDDEPTGRCINCDDDDEPRVLVASTRFTPPSGEVMGVTLTQIPITGVGSTLQSIIFTIGLLIISAGLAYLIMSRNMREKIVSIFSFGGQRYAVADDRAYGNYDESSRVGSENNDNDDIGGYASAAYAPTHPLAGGFGGATAAVDAERQQRVEDRFSELTGRKNITRQEDDPFSDRIAKEIGALARRESKREAAASEAVQGIDEMDTSALEARIEEEARIHKVLISDDGVKTLVRASSANENNAISILSELIKVSEEWYAREDGWLLLNQKRIKEVLFATYVMMVPTFFSWIAEGNEERMFGFIKMLQTQGHSAKEFIKNAVYELDALYRYRTEGHDSDVSNETIKIAGRWNLSTIEKMIESLIGAVDGSYSNDFTPIKLALLRTVSIAKNESRE